LALASSAAAAAMKALGGAEARKRANAVEALGVEMGVKIGCTDQATRLNDRNIIAAPVGRNFAAIDKM